MPRTGITLTGLAGSGSTTLGRNVAKAFKWPKPYYAGGVVRWLAERMEKEGRDLFLAKSDDEIIREITDALKSGEVPERPSIADDYRTFPPRLDRLVDEIQLKLLEELDCGVHEGRVAWFFSKKLHRDGRALDKTFLHVFCTVDPGVGAERQLRRPENRGKNAEQVRRETQARLHWERERYRDLYGIENHLDPANFDIIIDTTILTEEAALMRAIEEIVSRLPNLAGFLEE